MTPGTFQRLTGAAAACLFAAFLLQACGGGGGQPLEVVLDRPLVLLAEHFGPPAVPEGEDSPPVRLTINGNRREVIHAHPPEKFRFRVVPGSRTRLLFGVALDPAAWEASSGDGVQFSISVMPSGAGAGDPLWERRVNPRENRKDRRWFNGELDLSRWAGAPVTVELRTDPGPEGDEAFDWAVWSDPRLVSGPAVRETHPENLILITADTLRADHLGCYGAANPHTPHLDRLARSGAQFARAWSQFNTTNASHCSIMTSLYGLSHGVNDNLMPLHMDRQTLAETLGAEGYFCGAVTSVAHLGADQSGLGQGFRTYRSVGQERRAEDSVAAAAAWLERNGGSPFFLWLHLFDPHIFYAPGSEYLPDNAVVNCGDWPAIIRRQEALRAAELAAGGKLRAHQWDDPFYMNNPMREHLLGESRRDLPGRAYAGEVAYLDYCVGRLLADLGVLGLEESTAVVFVADHGESLGEHEIYFDHLGLYDVSLRVPLLMRLPRIAGRDLLETNLVETVDILPTCCQTLGLAAPEGIQGQSLVPLLEGGAPDGLRGAVYAQHAGSQAFAVTDGTWKLITRNGDWPMVTASGGDELYNLAEDPGEMRNLLRENPEEMARLSEMLQRWLTLTTRDDLPDGPELPVDEMAKRKEKLKALGYLQ